MRVNTFAVLVPKTTPHFDDFPKSSENQIRLSWQRCHMEPIAVAHPVYQSPHDHFG